MVDTKKIVETFERIEEEDGVLWQLIFSQTLNKTAAELGIPREVVRETMIDHWTMRGSG